VSKERPFFLFINYMEAHRPYDTRPRVGLLDHPVSQDAELIPKLYEAVMPGATDAPPELVRDLVDQYDTAIANLDEEIGHLLDGLRDLGRDADTVVVVIADHGEFFGEHRLAEHSKDVYQEVLAVPLIVRSPGQDVGRVVDTLVSSVDVPRLILEHLADPGAWSGQFPFAPGNQPVLAEVYFARPKDLQNPVWGARFDRIRTAFFEWPLKLIESSDGHHELYDLAGDPREARSLCATRRDAVRRLQTALDEFRAGRPRSEAEVEGKPLDEEELRAVGYVGR
jgi:arylsulfatase A-like enzyme